MTRPIAERFFEKVRRTATCWLWTGARDGGYGVIWAGPGQDKIRATRVSWEIAYGPLPKGKYVLHRCDNPACVRPTHLFSGDAAANAADRNAKARQARDLGWNGKAKISDKDVRAIRSAYATGKTSYAKLAESYGLSSYSVQDIVLGRRRQLAGSVQVRVPRARGRKIPLSQADVNNMRKMRLAGATYKKIGSRFHITTSTAFSVVRGRGWWAKFN